jgi:hypothetical protein
VEGDAAPLFERVGILIPVAEAVGGRFLHGRDNQKIPPSARLRDYSSAAH